MTPKRWQRPMFGPFRRRAHTGVPGDYLPKGAGMTRYGDGVTVIVADGPASDVFAGVVADYHADPDGNQVDMRLALGLDPGVDDDAEVQAALEGLREWRQAEIRATLWANLLDVAPFDVSSAAEGLIVTIDAAVDELMEELGIGDEDDGDAVATAVEKVSVMLLPRIMGHLAATVEPLGALHPPFTGKHSHPHSAMGQQGDDDTHSHSHSHNGDSIHSHSHGAAVDVAPRVGTTLRNLSESERRRVDAGNEIVDREEVGALVASALARVRDERGITAATRPDGTVDPAKWHAYLCVEGVRTDDGRELAMGSCRYPDLPISLRLLVEDEGGHWGAVTCGRIDTIEPVEKDGYRYHYAEGEFGSDPNGQLAELMVEEQTQRFVSIDPRDAVCEIVTIAVEVSGLYDYGEYDDDAPCISWLRISDCVIGAATIVAMPALPQAVITLANVDLPDAPIANASAPPGLGDLQSVVAAGGPALPPREWFEDPGFHVGDPRLVLQDDGRSYACPLTVTEDGRVFGHVAWWNCKHTGMPGRDVRPPRSKSGYGYYLTGEGVACADGTFVEGVGQVTMGTGHANVHSSWKAATAHYDGGYGAVQMADVRAGQDDFGPWIAGSLRSGLTDEQVREFRALSLSGDWREIGGHGSLELVAVLAVPVPGFPVKRSIAASGQMSAEIIDMVAVRAGLRGDRVVSLVAAGRVRPQSDKERIAALEQQLAELSDLVRPAVVAHMARLMRPSA